MANLNPLRILISQSAWFHTAEDVTLIVTAVKKWFAVIFLYILTVFPQIHLFSWNVIIAASQKSILLALG